ncbi:MAG: MFS transporter [Bacteroidetes bacterium]|nr:MAG: MFS transporter [Bacteroidota bacterium]
MAHATAASGSEPIHSKRLFWGCFIALVATSFGFIARALTADAWGAEFGLTETQVGEILGAGLWPFAISIILFSLIIDQIGYKVAMWFGLICHTLSTVLILMADGYTLMYLGTFVLALGSGTVEAYINPVVATVFNKQKTKWLNILHAGWPGGLVVGGILAIMLGDIPWRWKIAIILIPTVIYAVMLVKESFPVNERVAAGTSYRDMLREVGAVGALIIASMIVFQVGAVLDWSVWTNVIVTLVLVGIYTAYTRSLGRPLFIFLLLLMIPLATTELGVDSWITVLMENSMEQIGLAAGWVLVYTSAIMMVLRFNAGPIVHRLNPLGLLALSSVLACLGLVALSQAGAAITILLAATLYGVGKTFFWPTTLGIVAEQFPRGGALTLNGIAGVGMIAVGIVGAPFLGYIQDVSNAELLMEREPEMASEYLVERDGLFGHYSALNVEALATAPPEEAAEIAEIQEQGRKDALLTVAMLPAFMFLCYIGLILYFKTKGGYKPVVLTEASEEAAAATAV